VQLAAVVVTTGLHVLTIECTCYAIGVATAAALLVYIHIQKWIVMHTSIVTSMYAKLPNVGCNSCSSDLYSCKKNS
jgi:hypothetical protein